MNNDYTNFCKISKCWILDYQPTFNNLIYPKSYYLKLMNLIKYKNIPMNIMFVGLSGFGKFMFLKCILKYCYNIDMIKFKQHNTIQQIIYYESIYIIDFIFTKKSSFNDIFEFIKQTNKRNIIQFNNIPKLIILKNIDSLSNDNICKILTIIKTHKTLFIVLSKKNINTYLPFFNTIRLRKLSEKELKTSINKLLKSKKIEIKETNLTFKKIYKTYENTFFNMRNTILWVQFTLNNQSSTNKIMMPIKNKIVASLLNYILCDTTKMSANKELNTFEQIYNKIILLYGCGVDNLEIIKYSVKMLLSNKIIDNDKKSEIVNLSNNFNLDYINVERDIFPLKTFFFSLMILFK